MPGISLVCDLQRQLRHNKSTILQSLDSLKHTVDYKRRIVLDKSFCFLGCTEYQDYPVACFETDDFTIYLEGKLYVDNEDIVSLELSNLSKIIFGSVVDAHDQLTEWLLNTDGDFVVFILQKNSNRLAILNDVLGRLPIYYSLTSQQLVLSREYRFITNLLNVTAVDRMAMAQFLLFGYSLGERTLLNGIYRLKPASLIRVEMDSSRITINTLYTFNFQATRDKYKTIGENATELTRLFSQACKRRTAASRRNILSLSGGLDSRSVAACLHKHSIAFTAVSFLDADRIAENDAKISEEIARVLNVQWKMFELPPTTGRDLLMLLKLKSGLNYLAMSFILPFFENIKERYGSSVIFLTGDGGDEVLSDRTSLNRFKSIDALVQYILAWNQIFCVHEVARLAKIDETEILEEFKARLSTYPEDDWNRKHVHFLIYEKAFKWLFEGEDRNRCYFWSATPFYSIQFFNYAMGCSSKQKKNHALYRDFLVTLSPEAASIDNANWSVPISSSRCAAYLAYRAVLEGLPPRIVKWLKDFKSTPGPEKYRTCLREQIVRCSSLSTYLSPQFVNTIIQRCDKTQLETLLTVTSCIEQLECKTSTLENYFDSAFGNC